MKFISRILLALITFFLLSMLMTSCYTKKQAINKFCHQDSASVVVRDTIKVIVNQDTAKFVLAIDSLKNLLAKFESDTSLEEPPSRTIYEDSLFAVNAKLNKKTKELEWTLVHKKPIIKEVPIYFEKKVPCNCPPIPEMPWYIIVRNWIIYFFAAIGFLVILLKGFNKAIGG